MDPIDNFVRSLDIFNYFCGQTLVNDVNLTGQILNDYIEIVNNVAQCLQQIPDAQHSYILLYTDSFFDALNNLRYYLREVPYTNYNDFYSYRGSFATTIKSILFLKSRIFLTLESYKGKS